MRAAELVNAAREARALCCAAILRVPLGLGEATRVLAVGLPELAAALSCHAGVCALSAEGGP